MAYRKIHDSFWTDPDIEDLTPEQRYFYLYLLTNPACNQIGLFEFSIRRAVFETGYNRETIEKLLDHFEAIGKIKMSEDTKEIVICKFYEHNKSNSPKVKTHVEQLISKVKDTALIEYVYGIDTVSVIRRRKEEEEEKEEEKLPSVKFDDEVVYTAILEAWNKIFESSARMTNNKRRQIRQRLKTFTPKEILLSMNNRSKDSWLQGEGSKFYSDWDSFFRNDEKIERYLLQKSNQYIKNQTNPFK